VTLDDLLAELVGEVVEEIDEDVTSDVVAVAEGVYTVRGQIDIDDFAARFHHPLPPGEYTTLGGFLANQLGAVPSEGDQIQLDGLRLTVVSVDKNRVKRVRVHLPVETEESVT
jgi:CBS domain containing-hemolysin-like protein